MDTPDITLDLPRTSYLLIRDGVGNVAAGSIGEVEFEGFGPFPGVGDFILTNSGDVWEIVRLGFVEGRGGAVAYCRPPEGTEPEGLRVIQGGLAGA